MLTFSTLKAKYSKYIDIFHEKYFSLDAMLVEIYFF